MVIPRSPVVQKPRHFGQVLSVIMETKTTYPSVTRRHQGTNATPTLQYGTPTSLQNIKKNSKKYHHQFDAQDRLGREKASQVRDVLLLKVCIELLCGLGDN